MTAHLANDKHITGALSLKALSLSTCTLTHNRPPMHMVKETDDAMLHLFIDIQMARDFISLLTPPQGQVFGHPSKQTMTHKLMDQMKSCSYHVKLNPFLHKSFQDSLLKMKHIFLKFSKYHYIKKKTGGPCVVTIQKSKFH